MQSLLFQPGGAGGWARNLPSLQNHIPWANLSSSSSLFTLCTELHNRPPKDQVSNFKGSLGWLCALRTCALHVQEAVSCRFTYQHRIYPTWCKVLLRLWALYVPELQIYAGNRSVIRNQLLYQLCARELLGHRHLYYWSLDVLGIGHGFTVAGASRLWDHSFDPYAFAAFDRAESKFLLLILGFELQKEQPAGRGEERTASFRLLCKK